MHFFKFEQTCYLSAFKDVGNLKDDKALFEFVKSRAQFSYSQANNYQRFSEKYSSEGWLGRKVWAIPTAAYYAILENIPVIAICLIAFPILCFTEDFSVVYKHVFFRSVRQMQIGFGCMASLFNDRYGLYHIEEGHFYMTCYKCWSLKNTVYLEGGIYSVSPDKN